MTTFVAIGRRARRHRLPPFSCRRKAPPSFADVTAALPAGAKVLSTAIGNDHIVVTIEVDGVTELRTFDPDTLKPLGRLRLEPKH